MNPQTQAIRSLLEAVVMARNSRDGIAALGLLQKVREFLGEKLSYNFWRCCQILLLEGPWSAEFSFNSNTFGLQDHQKRPSKCFGAKLCRVIGLTGVRLDIPAIWSQLKSNKSYAWSLSGCRGSAGCHQWRWYWSFTELQGVPPTGAKSPTGWSCLWPTVVQQTNHQASTTTVT